MFTSVISLGADKPLRLSLWDRLCEHLLAKVHYYVRPAAKTPVAWRDSVPAAPANVAKGSYQKSRKQLQDELAYASSRHPGVFGPISTAPEIFRVERRPPTTIARAGLFPNPGKSAGDLEFHTVGDDPVMAFKIANAGPLAMPVKIDSTGSGSYVSFSTTDDASGTLAALAKTLFAEAPPDRLLYGDKATDKPLSAADWKTLLKSRYEDVDALPTEAVFHLYQYRARNVEGVAVTGGRFKSENEFVVRGATPDQVTEWRSVWIRVPLTYKHITRGDGREYVKLIAPDAVQSIVDKRYQIDNGDWQPMPR